MLCLWVADMTAANDLHAKARSGVMLAQGEDRTWLLDGVSVRDRAWIKAGCGLLEWLMSPSGREPLTRAQAVARVPRLARASFPPDTRCWVDHDRGRIVLEWSRGVLAMIAPPYV